MSATRHNIGKQTAELSDKHIYVRLLNYVNDKLIKENIPIGPNMEEAVRQNLDDVKNETGTTGPTFHAREAKALFRDSKNYASQGNYKLSAINLMGLFGNFFTFFLSGAHEHTEQKRRMIFGRK